jgi:hypothetical protein
MNEIKIGAAESRTLRISDARPGKPDIIFDVSHGDKVICSNVNEGQARQIVAALVGAFPELAELQYVVPVFPFPIAQFEDALTFVAPAPKVENSVGDLHLYIPSCKDYCFAARASKRLYGEAGHPVSEAQVEKQKLIDKEPDITKDPHYPLCFKNGRRDPGCLLPKSLRVGDA